MMSCRYSRNVIGIEAGDLQVDWLIGHHRQQALGEIGTSPTCSRMMTIFGYPSFFQPSAMIKS